MLFVGVAKLVSHFWELTRSRIIGGALSIITFNGWEVKNVVSLKKDVVLPNHPRIQGLQVCVGVSKRFRTRTGADEIGVSFKRNIWMGRACCWIKFPAQ